MRQLPFAETSYAKRGPFVQNETGRESGGGLWWRPTRQGILCRKLIPMRPGRANARLACSIKFIIGIDFLMPQKTQRRWHPRAIRLASLLELDRRAVRQSRMQSLHIGDLIDELCNILAQLFDGSIRPRLEFLVLQSLDEAFAPAVFPWRAGPAHAQDRTQRLQPIYIALRDILNSLIGMVNQARLGLPRGNRLFQRFQRQPYFQASLLLPPGCVGLFKKQAALSTS
jgi:hypothetical protein